VAAAQPQDLSMASQYDTAVIVGSLRKESFSLKIAKALT
jgi:hypothetical protein